jgi:divalent anion:Na+ symporter, DASS family
MINFLKTLSSSEKRRLSYEMRTKKFKKNETIYSKNTQAKYIYIIDEGEVSLATDGKQIDQVDHGSFGEESVLSIAKYQADAIAIKDTDTLMIKKDYFTELVKTKDDLKTKINESLIKHFIGESLEKDENVKSPKIYKETWLGWALSFLYNALILVYSLISNLHPVTISLWVIFGNLFLFRIFQHLPLYVAFLLFNFFIAFIQLVPIEIAFAGYSSPAFFLYISFLVVGYLLDRSSLIYRGVLIVFRVIPIFRFGFSIVLMLTGLLMTGIIPSGTFRLKTLSLIYKVIVGNFNIKSNSKMISSLAVATVDSSFMFAPFFLTGSGTNFILYQLLPAYERGRFSWFYWLYSSSLSLVFLFVMYFILFYLFFSFFKLENISVKNFVKDFSVLGKIRKDEKIVAIALFLFFIGNYLENLFLINFFFFAMIILLSIFLFSSFGIKDFKYGIRWSTLIWIGSAMSIAYTIKYINLEAFLEGKLDFIHLLFRYNLYVFSILVGLITIIMCSFIPASVAFLLEYVILTPFALKYGINHWCVGFLIILYIKSYLSLKQCMPYLYFDYLITKQQSFDKKIAAKFNYLRVALQFVLGPVTVYFWKLLGVL